MRFVQRPPLFLFLVLAILFLIPELAWPETADPVADQILARLQGTWRCDSVTTKQRIPDVTPSNLATLETTSLFFDVANNSIHRSWKKDGIRTDEKRSFNNVRSLGAQVVAFEFKDGEVVVEFLDNDTIVFGKRIVYTRVR